MINFDIIKIQMSKEGYLPSYPPHLISDNEMCDAFMKLPYPVDDDSWYEFLSSSESSLFKDYYPLVNPGLMSAYRELAENIAYHLNEFKQSTDTDRTLPDWILAYMNESVISVNSSEADLQTLLDLLHIDMVEPQLTPQVCMACYKVSKEWLRKLSNQDILHRSPTLYGAPHVIKALRISESTLGGVI